LPRADAGVVNENVDAAEPIAGGQLRRRDG
jgi:hypothetical protein